MQLNKLYVVHQKLMLLKYFRSRQARQVARKSVQLKLSNVACVIELNKVEDITVLEKQYRSVQRDKENISSQWEKVSIRI